MSSVKLTGGGRAGARSAVCALPQPFPTLPLERIDLGEHDRDVLLLLPQPRPPFREDLEEFHELRALAVGGFVEVEQLADFRRMSLIRTRSRSP